MRRLFIASLVICVATLAAGGADCSYLGAGNCTITNAVVRTLASPIPLIALLSSSFLVMFSYPSVLVMSYYRGVCWAVISGLLTYWLVFSVGMFDFRDASIELVHFVAPLLALAGSWLLGKLMARAEKF